MRPRRSDGPPGLRACGMIAWQLSMTPLTSREVISAVQPVSEELLGAVVLLDCHTVATAVSSTMSSCPIDRRLRDGGSLLPYPTWPAPIAC